ncbi:unnamed protein product [Symbiodinium necroappetens]|uniref:Uncharacterized protein n=1 Tax=Symbiodinium necroappetens TaxID=1628268 RepID=A0A812TR75_9DINO|nr:unnamed protein product [Symbiodinium necroappetens]
MPLSVSQRRAAVRQFVADKHGRPDDRRLDGPQLKRVDPGQRLVPAPDAQVAERRQAAVARVRQRRAERALESLASQDRHADASETKGELGEEADGLFDEREALGQDFEAQREPKSAVQLPEVEVFAQARDVASQENDHPGPPSTVEEDGWEPPPRPSMPAMPGPPSLAGIAADATLGFTPEGRSSLHDSLLEGSDDVDADLPGVGVAERREPEAHTMSLGVETPLLSALLLARLGVISACFSPQRRVRSHFSGAWGELAQSACTWR